MLTGLETPILFRGGRIGPQGVRVVRAEQLEMQARFDYLCAFGFSSSVFLLKFQSS